MRRLIVAGCVPAVLFAVAGCGGGSSSPATTTSTSTAPSSAPATTASGTSTSAGVDPCVVGSWRSTGATGAIGSAKSHITLTGGGAGAVVVIKPDGALGESFKSMQPISGIGSDHNSYTLTFSGAVSGQLQAANGQATINLFNRTDETVTLAQGSHVLGSSHPAGSGPSTYTCTPGQSLAVSSGGVTFHWAPAG